MITTTDDGKMEEVKMDNFFSLAGINFQNVRNNDQMVTDKLTSLANQGWELIQVTPGVYSADKRYRNFYNPIFI
ncbi:MAG: hypothetical protein ACK4ND_12620 [Cytophagaceae bacterium]